MHMILDVRERLIAASVPRRGLAGRVSQKMEVKGGLNPQGPPRSRETKCHCSVPHTLSRLPRRWLWSASLRISADGGGRLKSASLRISKEALRRRCCGFAGFG